MNGILTDLRFVLRQLVTRPGFTAAAILTLALGIGANTAVFSVLNGYLLKPLPYPHAGQLVQIDESEPKSGLTFGQMSIPIYKGIRQHVSAFSESGLFKSHSFLVESNGQTARVVGAGVTPSVFNVLGVRAKLGRTFADSATQPGRGHELVLSYSFWRQQFGGDRDVIGSDIRIAGDAYRVIGVMPQHFAFPDRAVRFWTPMTITAADRAMKNVFHFSPHMIARYRPGTSQAIAYRQLRAVWAQLGPEPAKQAKNGEVTFTLTPWRQIVIGDKSTTALLLQAAVLFLLLITCVNVANLLLSRILGRTHEMAMRAALGASRWRLSRQLLVEGLCLALPGGLVGVLLGWWSLHFFARSAIGPGDEIISIAPDWRVAGFAVVVVALTGLVVSLLPLWHLGRTDLQGLLQEGSRMSGGRRARRVRQALAVAELGLATVLLVGSGLLLHSLMRVESIDPGYQLQHVLLADLAIPSNEYESKNARLAFYQDAQQQLAQLPGVEAVGLTSMEPLSGRGGDISDFSVHHKQMGNPSAYIQTINNGFFKSLNIPILRGRGFNRRDTADSPSVVVINKMLARQAFPHGKPVGKKIGVDGKWRTVVGIVPTVKIKSLTQPVDRGTAYLPLAQGNAFGMSLTIETSLPPAELARSVRDNLRILDPSAVLYNVNPIHQRMLQTLDRRQATMNLVLIFGGIALALAFVGVYGVLSYAVRQRTNECGIRLALGAEPRDLLWLILRDGLVLLAFGLGIGLALAVALGYVASSQLFGVAPFDPLTLIGVAAVLSVATLLACYLPARHAARLDPVEALHSE